MMKPLRAPFPYFGGKSRIAAEVWARLGTPPRQYIEPFAGSLAMLLAAPEPASLEVVCDADGFIANFWRATKHQPAKVAEWADYPVSHVDLGARHCWLMAQRARLAQELHDPDWLGDAKIAGWWIWGQCAWIGSGWCEWDKAAIGQIPHVSGPGRGVQAIGQIPHVSGPGRGVQAIGQIPHVSDAGQGVQAIGKIPHVSGPGQGVQAIGRIPHVSGPGQGVQAIGQIPHVGAETGFMTSAGRAGWRWLQALATRLERVRIIHGDWSRCLNHHYGKDRTAVFLDPPYRKFENIYGAADTATAGAAANWAREHPHLRIAICGHDGDYDLPGWTAVRWSRVRPTYGSTKTRDLECVWFSPACESVETACLEGGCRSNQLELW